MTISRNNFEAYMLDYLEGNLDPLLTAELMAFLAENPELEKLIADNEVDSLPVTAIYTDKQSLKKDLSDLAAITPVNFSEFCIASAEGMLKASDRLRLSEYIALDSGRQAELELYSHLRLVPDPGVVFMGKEKLKKPVAPALRFQRLAYALGIAASVTLIILLSVRRPDTKHDSDTMASRLYPAPALSEAPASRWHEPALSIPLPALLPDLASGSWLQKNGSATDELGLADNRDGTLPKRITPVDIARVNSSVTPPAISLMYAVSGSLQAKVPEIEQVVPENESSLVNALLKRINFWKAAETAVSGFNYLTESQLSLTRNTDENGRLRGLALEMEDYSITGNKIK